MRKIQIILMSLVILAFAATSFFIYPQADDFSYASRVLEFGFKEAQLSEYMKWNGRYVATALLSISPLIWGKLFHYRLMPILLIALIFLSYAFLVRELFRSKLLKNEVWFWALSLTFLTITGFHTTAEGLYWLASSYSYTVAIVFFNICFGLIWSENKTLTKYLLASVSAFILTGCNETSMVLWMYALGVTVGFEWLRFRRIPKGLIWVCLVSLAGVSNFLIVYRPISIQSVPLISA